MASAWNRFLAKKDARIHGGVARPQQHGEREQGTRGPIARYSSRSGRSRSTSLKNRQPAIAPSSVPTPPMRAVRSVDA